MTEPPLNDPKTQAAERALAFLEGGETLGLGSGSTAERFLERLAERYASGQVGSIVGVPTSERTAERAEALGLPLTSLDVHPELDLTVDGADEVDPRLDLVKGLGGALTHEKIVAAASRKLVIIVDEGKQVDRLGTSNPVPLEVLAFARAPVERALRAMGAEPELRTDEEGAFCTDEGNLILDATFPGGLADPTALARKLDATPGVVEHGLFLGMASAVVVGSASGSRVLAR